MTDERWPQEAKYLSNTDLHDPAKSRSIAKLYALDPSRSIMSTVFKEDRDSLCELKRGLVDMMRVLFFRPDVGTHSGPPADSILSTSRYDCAIGTIYYHFSETQGAIVMQCFVLRGGGGGGGGLRIAHFLVNRSVILSSDNDDGLPCWDEGIAARLKDLCVARLPNLRDGRKSSDLIFLTDLAIWQSMPRVEAKRSNQRNLGDRILVEIASACRGLSHKEYPLYLPEWSLLTETTLVSQQLENAYARAIFAGEALCKIGLSLDLFSRHARALRAGSSKTLSNAAHSRGRTALFIESLEILHAIRDGAMARTQDQFHCYLTASLMGPDMLGDLRRLRLIQGEMTYRFGMALAARPGNRRDLPYRYAKFAEFAQLSSRYFGVDDCGSIDPDIIDEIDECAHRGDPFVKQLVRNLDDFGTSTAIIIDQLASPQIEQVDHGENVHDRLCWLASEILSVESSVPS